MFARLISVLIMLPIVLAVVVYARPLHFLLALGLVGTLCLHEYFQLTRKMGFHSQPLLGYAAFWVLLIGFYSDRVPQAAVIAVVFLACFLAAMWQRDSLRESVNGMMSSLLGICYLTFFLYPALPVRFHFGNQLGLHWFLILLAVIWVGDTASLFVGRSLGRTLFAPNISPKKTNEGAVGGLLAGVLAGVLLQHFLFTELPLFHVTAVALLLGMFGQLGDLAESMLKRAAEVKDSSHLIPGHGGILDRVDSLLFAFPVLYVYLLRLYSS
jgi:phosphatidate cytidylyltransferase